MRFRLQEFPDRQFESLTVAAQEAEMAHAETNRPQCVLANQDEPLFKKDEIVYESRGYSFKPI